MPPSCERRRWRISPHGPLTRRGPTSCPVRAGCFRRTRARAATRRGSCSRTSGSTSPVNAVGRPGYSSPCPIGTCSSRARSIRTTASSRRSSRRLSPTSPTTPMSRSIGASSSSSATGSTSFDSRRVRMPPDSTVLVELDADAAVATITLNRPEALNALTVPMKVELLGAFRQVERDATVRAVILTGAGRAFCAGQDLRERLEPNAAPLGVEVRERYNPIIRAMRGLPKPIIGAINGVAAGAGASLAMACDIRIASDAATFSLAFGRVGLVPDSGATWFLPRLVGATRAAELALLNDAVAAPDAVRLGLVGRVVPAEQLATEARAVAARLAAGAPKAIALTKRALDAAWERDLEATLEYEAQLQDMAGRTKDHAEGLAAFVEKRP